MLAIHARHLVKPLRLRLALTFPRSLSRSVAGGGLSPRSSRLANCLPDLKLIDHSRVDWRGRSHFFAVGAEAMRRVLVNHAKSKQRLKRGGGFRRVTLDEPLAVSADRDEDVLALDEALEKLATLDPRQAKLVELRFFGGLSVAETAELLGISQRTVERDWTACRAWLRRELSNQDQP